MTSKLTWLRRGSDGLRRGLPVLGGRFVGLRCANPTYVLPVSDAGAQGRGEATPVARGGELEDLPRFGRRRAAGGVGLDGVGLRCANPTTLCLLSFPAFRV